MVSATTARSFTTGCTRGVVCLVVVKLIQGPFCTCAVGVAAGFEVLIHGSVAGCGQWDTPVTEALIHIHPTGAVNGRNTRCRISVFA